MDASFSPAMRIQVALSSPTINFAHFQSLLREDRTGGLGIKRYKEDLSV